MDLSLDLKLQAKKRRKDKNATANGDAITVAAGEDPPPMQLEECLARFTGEEKLSKEDYRCNKCQKQRDATKQLSLRKSPPVLVVHLKRFSHTKDKSSKVELPVSFPMDLNMVPYTAWHQRNLANGHTSTSKGTTSSTSKEKETNGDANPVSSEAMYMLSAVIVHKGDINSGHYVSYAREGRDWFMFDDSKVVLVTENEVLAAQAYLLVYVMAKV
jgi:ubiquitin carboxyl-terminal hydrolase 22/27/51